MTSRPFLVLLGVVTVSIHCVPGRAQEQSKDDATSRCKALASTDFSGIPDAVTQVMEGKLVPPSDDTVGYCEVRGYVAPSVEFLLRLPPDQWNGKLMELGCGGACGSTAHISACDDPLRRGYACIVSNGGHTSSGLDVKWAYNNPQAVVEYLVRASHVTAAAGKNIVARYYSQTPSKSYFMGCSAGGVQAMLEAERFPWDFDGIVAGGPALSITGIWMNLVWGNRALTGKGGEPLLAQSDLDFLHRAVVAKCDMNDGIKDGVIGDPRACHFDPSELACTGGKKSDCLTAEQVEAVRKIYGGPVTSKGEQIVMPIALRGSEQTWLGFFGGSAKNPTGFYNYTGEWFRYFLFQPNPGPAWEPKDFDFDRDYKRLGAAEILEPAISPDLRRLKAVGGKLLSYTGWNDGVEGVLRTVDYYETAQKIMGGRAATQDFFRLFVVPGMNHCGGGDGASAIDYLSYLEGWVERGQAPEKLVGSHVKVDDLMEKAKHGDQDAMNRLKRRQAFPLDPAYIEFSRPVYPYPTGTRYLGHGDPRDATSFGPVEP